MFIYTGKLQWSHYGVDELLVVVLPSGPVRIGDSIYTYSQWTVDSKGNKKQKWFSHQPIDKVSRAENGDDSFHFGQGWYKYEVLAREAYRTISITMSNPGGGKSTMTLERTYFSSGETPPAPARMWTGRLDWQGNPGGLNSTDYANDEPFMVIVPEGFAPGSPVLAFWQWTETHDKRLKVNCVRTGAHQAEGPSEGSPLGFVLVSDYTMTFAWDAETEKLAVRMEGPDKHAQDVGPLDLAALIKFHSHDLTPPEIPGEKVELEVHYPRAEQALPRIQSPLPFPPTLVETLAHTAAFLDRAGYQAKYAVDRYQALDTSYHAQLQQADELNKQIRELSAQVAALTTERDGNKKQVDSLQKQLADQLNTAVQKEAELQKQIQDLQRNIASNQTHDAADHKALDAAHEQIRQDQEVQATLQKQTLQLQTALAQATQRIQQYQAQVSALSHEASNLRGQFAAEAAHNRELQAQAGELKAAEAALQTEVAAAKKTLARTAEDLRAARAEADDKDKIIDGLETGLVAVKKDRDAKKIAYEELQKASSATILLLEEEIAQLRAGLA